MSESRPDSGPPRPRPVTFAGVIAATGCALLVFDLYDVLGRIRSTEVRGSIADALAGQGALGLSVDDVVGVLRVVVMVSAALSAAGVVLAVYALRRHRGARVALSVVAGIMLVSTTFVSGFLPLLIAFATGRLWLRDSRDWFDGKAPAPEQLPHQRPDRTGGRAPDATPSTHDAPGAPPTADAPSTPPPSDAPSTGADPWSTPAGSPAPDRPPPSTYPYGTTPTLSPPPFAYTSSPSADPTSAPAPSRTVAAGARPASVTVAAWLTWVASGLAVLVLGVMVLVLVLDRAALVDALEANDRVAASGLSTQEIIGLMWVSCAVGIAWSLAAIALAVLAYRRVRAGRVGLIVSAAALGLLGLLLVPVGWLHAAAAITVVVLLLQGRATRWYAGSGPAGPSAPSGSSGQGGSSSPDRPPVW